MGSLGWRVGLSQSGELLKDSVLWTAQYLFKGKLGMDQSQAWKEAMEVIKMIYVSQKYDNNAFNIHHVTCNLSPIKGLCLPYLFFLSRVAQQSRWSVHISTVATTSTAPACLHLRPPGTLHPSQSAEENHADAMSGQPGRPGGRHQFKHRPGTASWQLGAEQQHSLRDQVGERNEF